MAIQCMTVSTGALGILLFCCAAHAEVSTADQAQRIAPKLPVEGKLESFLSESKVEIQKLFTGERFPNVAVALDGTVVATWGRHILRARRSEDGGKTWQNSKPFPMMGTGEGAIVELSDGRLYYSSRRHWFKTFADFTAKRSFAWSSNGGETWVDAGYDDVLPDGPRHRTKERRHGCYNNHFGMMCGLVRLPIKGEDILIYSNADTPGYVRVRMTVWASFDGGKTWPVKRLVTEGSSAYSSLSAGRPGTASEGRIYLLFEGGKAGHMARFNLSWLLDGEKTGEGEIPDWVKTKN